MRSAVSSEDTIVHSFRRKRETRFTIIADLRIARFAGFPAWLIWAGVHIYFLIGFGNRFFVLLQWGLALVTKRRQVRILTSPAPREEPGEKPAGQ